MSEMLFNYIKMSAYMTEASLVLAKDLKNTLQTTPAGSEIIKRFHKNVQKLVSELDEDSEN